MFENSLTIVEECGLTYLHVFPFSARRGTPASRMPQLPKSVIRERARALRDKGRDRLDAFLRAEVGALRSILSELLRQERIQVVSDVAVAEPRTRLLLAKLGEWKTDRALIVTEQDDLNLYLAARNLPNVRVIDSGALDPVSLVHAERVVLTVDSVKKIEEWLA